MTCVRIGTARRPRRVCITPGRKNGTQIGRNATFFEVSRRTQRITRASVTRTVD